MRTYNRAANCGWPRSGFPRLPLGSWAYGGIHFGEVLPQFRRLFPPPLIGERRKFDGADADGFILQHAAPQQAFNHRLLVWKKIFGIADHRTEPDSIMNDRIAWRMALPYKRTPTDRWPLQVWT